MKVLFRVNASRKIGTGHLYECLWLAKNSKFESVFCVNRDAAALKLVKQFGFSVRVTNSPNDLNLFVKKYHPDVLIFNVLDIDSAYLEKIRAGGAKIVVMNAFKNPVSADAQIATVTKPHPDNKQYFGTEYILLKPALLSFKPKKLSKKMKDIFLLFGGADVGNFTSKSLRAISRLAGDFRVTVVSGPANTHGEGLTAALKRFTKPWRFYQNISNDRKLAGLMREADLALVSGGYTISELMYLGIPVIALAQTQIERDQVYEIFPKSAFINLGLGKNVTQNQLAKILERLIKNYRKRTVLSREARTVVDGQGISRLQKLITRLAMDSRAAS